MNREDYINLILKNDPNFPVEYLKDLDNLELKDILDDMTKEVDYSNNGYCFI